MNKNQQEEKAPISEQFIPKVKTLPRHPETGDLKRFFTANGTIYYILSAEEGIPVSRWGWYKKFSTQAGAGMNFSKLYTAWSTQIELLNQYVEREVKMSEIMLHADVAQKSLAELTTERFDNSLYLCSLFIVTKGEDMGTWSVAKADKKIEDWQMEGYGINDFFLLASSSIKGCNTILKAALQNGTIEVEEKWRKTFGTESGDSPKMEKEK